MIVPALRSGAGGSTVGIGRAETSGPLHGTENAANPSAFRLPSCRRRTESVLSERPRRSSTVSMLAGPGSGAEV